MGLIKSVKGTRIMSIMPKLFNISLKLSGMKKKYSLPEERF